VNCETILNNLGFDCHHLGEDTLRIWSPFSYGFDGQLIGLYVEKHKDMYRITDDAESLMHLRSIGIDLTKAKLTSIKKASTGGVSVSEGGEICMTVGADQLQSGITAVLNTALAVSHFETMWMPRKRMESFTKLVSDILVSELGADKILKRVPVLGASGHQLELPIAIKFENVLTYVQPVAASEEDKTDWTNVYSAFGKMTDLKNAGATDTARVFVLEDTSIDFDKEHDKAVGVLSGCGSVVTQKALRRFTTRFKHTPVVA